LLKEMKSLQLDKESLLIFTSDRGQALGEHGVVGEVRPWLHDELLHLPLIVRLPGSAEAGGHVSALTQSVDVLPTLLESFGLGSAAVHGQSLFPLLRGQVDTVREYACAGLRVGEEREWAIRTPEWSYLSPQRPETTARSRQPRLYVKPDDRWEVNDISQHHPEVVERLGRTLRQFVAATRDQAPFQPPGLGDIKTEEALADMEPTRGKNP